jgi:hypothetical protein
VLCRSLFGQCGTADIDLRSGGNRPARAPGNLSLTGTGTDAIAGHTHLPMKNKELSKMLSYRGMKVVKVADQVFSGRVAVTLSTPTGKYNFPTWLFLVDVLVSRPRSSTDRTRVS